MMAYIERVLFNKSRFMLSSRYEGKKPHVDSDVIGIVNANGA